MKTGYLFFLLSLMLVSCSTAKKPVRTQMVSEDAVKIENKGLYYLVTLDFTKGFSHRQIGEQYGKAIRKMDPEYAEKVGFYVSQIASLLFISKETLVSRVEEIRLQLNPDYRDEIEGIASCFTGYSGLLKKLSAREILYVFNLFSDVARTHQCSAFAAWDSSSSTGSTIAFRSLDWFGGLFYHPLPSIQSVTRLVYPDKTVYLFGALGHVGCVTGLNFNTGIFGGILDADVENTTYDAKEARSYNFDLREALERFPTSQQVAGFLKDPAKNYTFSHLIFLADEKSACILENNISGKGDMGRRTVRTDTSELNTGVTWGYPKMVGAENGFILKGQVDNMNAGKNARINQGRWSLMKEQIGLRYKDRKSLTPEQVREIMTSYRGDEPGSLMTNDGDLYNIQTQQMFLYLPAERKLEVFFKPLDGSSPLKPEFVPIPLGL